ncbi:MAG: hypothetical protein QOH83_1661 [Solirubrobacteraceae bacterium]|nr:hypothetical protein [Solirubrobacteraceae bacterium]
MSAHSTWVRPGSPAAKAGRAGGSERRRNIRAQRDHVDTIMNGALLLLAVLAVPYLALNVRRLRRGRSWAFTVCQVAKEWEEREHAKRLALRAADRP